MSWFGEFFGTLPEALNALWEFGDPAGLGRGWMGVFIAGLWGILLMALPLLVARATYQKHEWVSATMGCIGGLGIFWWVYGVLPSAWIYFLDSQRELLEGPIVPASAGITGPFSILGWQIIPPDYRLAIASNLYDVIRDLVVVVEHGVAFVLTFWAALKIQKRLPKSLVPGEIRPESGGYR